MRCKGYPADPHEEELKRQYLESYERIPESEDEKALARIGQEKLAELLTEDTW